MANITGLRRLSKIADPANRRSRIRTMKLLGRSSRSSRCLSRSGWLGSRCFRSRCLSFRCFAAADEAEAETESDSSERDANNIHKLFFPFSFNSGSGGYPATNPEKRQASLVFFWRRTHYSIPRNRLAVAKAESRASELASLTSTHHLP